MQREIAQLVVAMAAFAEQGGAMGGVGHTAPAPYDLASGAVSTAVDPLVSVLAQFDANGKPVELLSSTSVVPATLNTQPKADEPMAVFTLGQG